MSESSEAPAPSPSETRIEVAETCARMAVHADRRGWALLRGFADEAAFNVFSALTGTLTTHYWYLATLTSWAADHGIVSEDADRYVRSLFQGVGRSLSDETRSLPQLAADHETPNGNNERIRTT
jgi:hypothetical protein